MEQLNIISYKEIEQFDGPILDLVTTVEGKLYARKWCDVNVFMLTPTTTARIGSYKLGKISMLDLLTEFQTEVVLQDVKENSYSMVAIKDLPKSYLPQADAFYDESLAPENED